MPIEEGSTVRTLTISLRLAGIIAGAVLALRLVVFAQNRTGSANGFVFTIRRQFSGDPYSPKRKPEEARRSAANIKDGQPDLND